MLWHSVTVEFQQHPCSANAWRHKSGQEVFASLLVKCDVLLRLPRSEFASARTHTRLHAVYDKADQDVPPSFPEAWISMPPKRLFEKILKNWRYNIFFIFYSWLCKFEFALHWKGVLRHEEAIHQMLSLARCCLAKGGNTHIYIYIWRSWV